MTIQDIIQSPRLGMENALVEMEEGLNGNTIGRDYTSAYHNLLETSRLLAVDSLMGTANIIRKKFPILANNMEDLFFNIHDEVKDNLFSIGGTVPMVFYINVMDLRQYGIRENSSFITTIPSGSTITVLETSFTLLNDIIITLKDNNIITIEQIENELDIAINNVKLLQSNIYTDDNGIEWILFETKVRNVIKTTKIENISHSGNLSLDIPLTLKYSTITAGYINNGIYNKMAISYSDEYLNENVPTAFVTLKDNLVNVIIPKKYISDGNVLGNVVIDVYETDGEKSLDLTRVPIEEFTLNIENQDSDKYKATSINITMVVASRGTLNNGINAMSFEELKNAIVNSTLGDIDLPITSNQLKRKVKMYGYELKIVDDSLLGREFIASKPLPDIKTSMIKSYPDIYFNKSEIDINDEQISKFINIYENLFIIKENSIHKKDSNGILKLLSNEDYDYFNKLNKVSKIKYLKDNKLFYSPFTYVIKYEKDITNSEVYYLKPNIENIRILDSNPNILLRANTSKYGIFKIDNGFNIKTAPILNDELSSTDLTKLKARLHIPIRNSNSTVYFDTNYDVTNKMFSFDIITGELFDSVYKVLNGNSILKDINIDLNTNMYLYIYTSDNTIIDSSNFLYNEFGLQDKNVILNKELFTVKLGTKLNYIYNNVLTLFNNRQYKRHESTIPLTYENDVYEKYDNGLIINPRELSNGRVELNMKLLHSKGDVVLDSKGEMIYKSKAGDIILDKDNKPIVDNINGIKRVMDILMLEYEYIVADTETHINYLDLVMNNILAMVYTDMEEINDITMDITKIKYKTFRNMSDVNIIVNNILYPIPYNVTPNITLILDKNNIISDSVLIEEIKSICGKVITKHLNSEKILLSNIKKDLIDNISISIIGIKISGIEPKNNEAIITTDENRFSINKILELTETNNMIVKYDINLEMEYI